MHSDAGFRQKSIMNADKDQVTEEAPINAIMKVGDATDEHYPIQVQGDSDNLTSISVQNPESKGLFHEVITDIEKIGDKLSVEAMEGYVNEQFKNHVATATNGEIVPKGSLKENALQVLETASTQKVSQIHDAIISGITPLVSELNIQAPELSLGDEINHLIISTLNSAKTTAENFIHDTINNDQYRLSLGQYGQFMKDTSVASVTNSLQALIGYMTKRGNEELAANPDLLQD